MAPSAKQLVPTISSIWARDADLHQKVHDHEQKIRGAKGWKLLMVAYSTLGIVYGDLGTSPLYTYSSIFTQSDLASDPRVVMGVFSMIFWSITLIILIEYVFIILRADDNGEGGTFALYSLLCRAANVRPVGRTHETDVALVKFKTKGQLHAEGAGPKGVARIKAAFERSHALQTTLLIVVLISACMVISDGVLTPAISVVSAIEGIQLQTGLANEAVVGITCGILVLVFSMQSLGTAKVAAFFAPCILLWFLSNASIGIYNIVTYDPTIFKAMSPHWIYYYWANDSFEAWRGLGDIMLAITGAEALYADLGHFSKSAIRISFCTVVWPSLTLAYLGQTALLIERPEAGPNMFWESIPKPVFWPMVVLATASAIIASQALISGAFTIVQQAMSMNCVPRFTVKFTSRESAGQIYIPEVNWLLMCGSIAIVAIMQNSVKIGNAYGLAVILVMLATTSLISLVMLLAWEWRVPFVLAFWLLFTFVQGAFLSSNLEKVPKGAWFSLALSLILTCFMYCWYWGQSKKGEYVRDHKVKLRDLFEVMPGSNDGTQGGAKPGQLQSLLSDATDASTVELQPGLQQLRLVGIKLPVTRVPGVGVYCSELLTGLPPTFVRLLEKLPTIYEVVVLLTVRFIPVPNVLPEERLLIKRLRFEGFYHVVSRYGYMDSVDLGTDFMDTVMQEILVYLTPGIAPAGSSSTSLSLGFALAPDLETAGGGPAAAAALQSAEAHRRVVHIDSGLGDRGGGQQLAGLRQRRQLSIKRSVQLVDLPAGGGSSATGSGGGASLERGPAGITLAVPLEDGLPAAPADNSDNEDEGGEGGLGGGSAPGSPASAPAATSGASAPGTAPSHARPWVQQPSMLRRVQTMDARRVQPLAPPLPRAPIYRTRSTAGAISPLPSSPLGRRASYVQQQSLGVASIPETEAPEPAGTDAADSEEESLGAEKRGGLDKRELFHLTSLYQEVPGDSTTERERELVLGAYAHGVNYLLGKSTLAARQGSGWFRRLVLNGFFRFLAINTRGTSSTYHLPAEDTLETVVQYHV